MKTDKYVDDFDGVPDDELRRRPSLRDPDDERCPACRRPVGMYSAEVGKIVCSGPACGVITEVDAPPLSPRIHRGDPQAAEIFDQLFGPEPDDDEASTGDAVDDTCDECGQRHGPGDEEYDGMDLAPESIAPAANERPWEASAAPSQPDRVTVGGLTCTPPRSELFAGADQGTSHVPEDRARQRRQEFDADVAHLVETAGPFLTGADLDRYVAAWSGYLAALGRCVSTLVAGRSNFPARRAQKASASADRRLEELLELKKRLIRSAKRERWEAEVEAAGGPVAILRQDVETTTHRLAMMKAANRIVRSRPRNVRTDGKIERLVSVGVGPAVAESLFVEDFAGRFGYPGFLLTSARTDIKRKEERIAELERRDEQSGREDEIHAFGGVTVTLCYADNKIRIQHDEIPAKEFRQTLNTSGWNFSRREVAWQRQLTENAIWSAEQLLGVKIAKSKT